MKKKIIIAVILIALLIAMFSTTVKAEVKYGHVGYHCNKESKTSGKLLIGDSRTCQLWDYDNSGASFVAIWGGHYGYGGTKSQIDTNLQRLKMKKYTKDTIKKIGYCSIYIFATVNDYNGEDEYQYAANSVFSLAETAYSWTEKFNNKIVHPNVYVVSNIGSKDVSVSKYNDYLEDKVNDSSKIKGFIDIKDCLSGSNSGYQSDNLHYNDETLQNIWNKISETK